MDKSPEATPISACVISFQEADRIEDCLRSLAFCDEVVVLDSGSTDGTIEKARALGAKVSVNAPFPGHREQKQLCVERAAHDWVLCLDADERIMPDLRERLVDLMREGPEGGGYEMPRRNHYLGRIVRRGLFWPDRKLRFFDRRVGAWRGTNPHDKVYLDAGQSMTRLEEGIEHLSYRDFADHKRTVDSFTAIAAKALYAEGRRFRWVDLLFRPVFVFLKSLVLKRGFVDGWRGVLIACMAFYYDWLKYWRLRAVWRSGGEA